MVNPQCTLPIVWERLSRICKAGRHLPQVEAALPAGCPSLQGPGTRDTGSQQHPPPQLAHRAVTMAAVGPEWTGLTCRDNNRRSGKGNSWWYTVVFIWRKIIFVRENVVMVVVIRWSLLKSVRSSNLTVHTLHVLNFVWGRFNYDAAKLFIYKLFYQQTFLPVFHDLWCELLLGELVWILVWKLIPRWTRTSKVRRTSVVMSFIL